MKFLLRIIVLLATIAFVQGCSPVDNVTSQATDLGKNIIISRDSTASLDPALVRQMVIGVIEVDKVASVIVNVHPGVLYCLENSPKVWDTKFIQIYFRRDGAVDNVEYETFYPASASRSDFYASCPNSSMETYWTTECSTISTATSAINTNHSAAKNRGYVSTGAIGSGESLKNVNNYLSCSGLKVWGRVGHGYTGGLQHTGGQLLSSFSMSLDNHGIYANSCQAYNNPFKSKVFNAGAEWFVAGITNLTIGSSEAVFKCTMQKALSQTNVCSALNSCMQSGAGTHGCGGPNRVIPVPGGGPNPTPTPGPTPTPTPGQSCVGHCDGKSPDGCWCDSQCSKYNDCCPDYAQACGGGLNPTPTPAPTATPAPTPTPGQSCVGHCGGKSPDGCWCDSQCVKYNDCCPDYQQAC
jgi:hypothetical protein